MNVMEQTILLSELASGMTVCELNHGPEVGNDAFKAVDFINLPIGYKEQEGVYKQVGELVIPVCEECAISLIEDHWTLLYCIECAGNQWIHRNSAKMNYRHHVVWLQGCPECTNELKGLYFYDENLSGSN